MHVDPIDAAAGPMPPPSCSGEKGPCSCPKPLNEPEALKPGV